MRRRFAYFSVLHAKISASSRVVRLYRYHVLLSHIKA